jgi:hypothetical protein
MYRILNGEIMAAIGSRTMVARPNRQPYLHRLQSGQRVQRQNHGASPVGDVNVTCRAAESRLPYLKVLAMG